MLAGSSKATSTPGGGAAAVSTAQDSSDSVEASRPGLWSKAKLIGHYMAPVRRAKSAYVNVTPSSP
jgi:hypothetical protein